MSLGVMLVPLRTAKALLNDKLPKSSNATKFRSSLGISSIHSAEESDES